MNFDRSNQSDLLTHKKFENYIDLHLRINDTINRQKNNYTIQMSTQNSLGLKFDKTILVYRIDMKDVEELFVTISDLTHDFRVSY